MNNDRPDILPLDRHACMVACAFICPYMDEKIVTETMGTCRRNGENLALTKETITGTMGERHPVTVGVRTWYCKQRPPQFALVDKKPKRSRKNAVDQP